MESLTELVRNLSMLLLAAAFLELLVPKGRLSSLVRLLLGLLLMVALLSPITDFLRKGDGLAQWEQSLALELDAPADYAQQGMELGDKLAAQADLAYQQALEEQLSYLAQSQPGVAQAAARVVLNEQGLPERVELALIGADPIQAEDCAAAVAKALGMERNRVGYQVVEEENKDE